MALSWTESAIADLEHIRRYVTAVDRAAARRLADRIVAVATTIEHGPASPAGSIAEVAVADPFVIRYRRGAHPVVMTVRHGVRGMII